MKGLKIMNDINKSEKLKIKYPILKKEGYKLNYADKYNEYIDIYFIKKVDEATSLTISINEKYVSKRIDNETAQGFTKNEIKGIKDRKSVV